LAPQTRPARHTRATPTWPTSRSWPAAFAPAARDPVSATRRAAHTPTDTAVNASARRAPARQANGRTPRAWFAQCMRRATGPAPKSVRLESLASRAARVGGYLGSGPGSECGASTGSVRLSASSRTDADRVLALTPRIDHVTCARCSPPRGWASDAMMRGCPSMIGASWGSKEAKPARSASRRSPSLPQPQKTNASSA
jgi:hypothetical protein